MTLAIAIMTALAIPTAAFAYTPTGDDFITCVAGGDLNVECSAGVFLAGSTVSVLVTGSTLLDTDVTADADGIVSFDFDVPADHPDGSITVALTGTGPDGDPKVLQDTEAATVADGAVIANAGAESMPIAAIAIAALAIGGSALFLSRRSKSEVA